MGMGGHNGTILSEGTGSLFPRARAELFQRGTTGLGEACHGRGAGFDTGLATTRT